MKFFVILLGIFLIFVKSGLCLRLEDLLPMKYDVVKVRSEKQLKSRGDEYAVLDFIGLVERHKGYKAEEHTVVTSDGYVLTSHRITTSPKSPRIPGKPVVFLKHALALSSDSFVLIGPDKDLAFLLADAGYDVWLGNGRGNTYSRYNVNLSPKDKKFWKFSFHEIGAIDLRHMIDQALEISGKQSLIYIGYSEGTTESYVLLSTYPEYNKKISLCISLAPLASFTLKLPIVGDFLVNHLKLVQDFTEKLEYYEFVPQSSFMGKLGTSLCTEKSKEKRHRSVCTIVLDYVMPIADVSRFNTSAYPTIMSHCPAGTSIQPFYHLGQNYVHKKFQMYDYGPETNKIKYGQVKPPVYNFTKITAPVAIFYANKDYAIYPEEAENVCRSLPNVVVCKKIPSKNFNHLDYLWSLDAKTLLYDDIISLMNEYKN